MEPEKYKAREARHLELIRATVAFEHAALRPTFLLNGGALIAVLTFLGHAWTRDGSWVAINKVSMIWAIISWALGVFTAGAATFFGYTSQHEFLLWFRHRGYGDDAAEKADHEQTDPNKAESLKTETEKEYANARKHCKKANQARRCWLWAIMVS